MAEIRSANPRDVSRIFELIHELAEFEKLTDQLIGTETDLHEHLFGVQPKVEALVAEDAGVIVGYAIFFGTYSTFRTQPGIWLEDLYVTPEMRGTGIGKALLHAVAELANERGCGRFEWSVLDWNTTAVEFYKSLGAEIHPEWWNCRLSGERLAAYAKTARVP